MKLEGDKPTTLMEQLRKDAPPDESANPLLTGDSMLEQGEAWHVPNPEPDLLSPLMKYALVVFLIVSLMILGGRDLALLAGSETTQAKLVSQPEPYDCLLDGEGREMCYRFRYEYVASGETYHASVVQFSKQAPTLTIRYSPYAPWIYKKVVE